MIDIIKYWCTLFDKVFDKCYSVPEIKTNLVKSKPLNNDIIQLHYEFVYENINLNIVQKYDAGDKLHSQLFNICNKESKDTIISLFKSVNPSIYYNYIEISYDSNTVLNIDHDTFHVLIEENKNIETKIIDYESIKTEELHFQLSCLYALPCFNDINDLFKFSNEYAYPQIHVRNINLLKKEDLIPREIII